MAHVLLKGNPTHLEGHIPSLGTKAPDFLLTAQNLKDLSLKDFEGKKKILVIVPSLETPTCSISSKKFHEALAKEPNVALLLISCDLPFAQKRWCGEGKLDQITTLSLLRSKKFGQDYGVLIQDGPLQGLCARAVIVLDNQNIVKYTELVKEISEEPNYELALKALTHL